MHIVAWFALLQLRISTVSCIHHRQTTLMRLLHLALPNVLRSFEAYYPCISARGTDAMNRLASRMIEAVCKTSLRNLVLFRYTRAHRKCRGRWWCTISLNNCNTSEDDGRSLGSFIVIFRMRGSRKSRFSNFWGVFSEESCRGSMVTYFDEAPSKNISQNEDINSEWVVGLK